MRVPLPALTLAGLLLAVPLAGGAALGQQTLKPADLTGTYHIVGGEREGTQEPPERIKGTRVRFSETTVVVTSADQKEIYAATYTLAPADKAGASKIRMTSRVPGDRKEQALGLIARDKDGLVRLIYSLPGGGEPTEFRTKTQQLMFVLKPGAGDPPADAAPARNTEP